MKGTLIAVAAGALLIAGCRKAPEPPTETRPIWRGASVDGLAPLMSPTQVQAALDRAGYRQIACGGGLRPLLDDPLNSGRQMPCYQSPSRPMRLSLYFLDLVEGRRLAVITFTSDTDFDNPKASIAAGERVVSWLRTRFGKTIAVADSREFRTLYWRVPGGRESLPDMLSTTVGASFGANLTMTSMWAYGQERPDTDTRLTPAPQPPPPPAPPAR